MNKRILAALGVLVIATILFVGLQKNSWTSTQINNSAGRIDVVTSFYPLYFLASEIGGERAVVTNITPAGVEPHEYEPRGQDIARILRSDVLILNGGGLEPWGKNIQKSIDSQYTTVVVVGDGLVDRDVVEAGEKVSDPHIWLSPKLASKMADTITGALIRADASNAEYYEANAQALKVKLDQLNGEFVHGLSSCKRKDFITSHEAFGYMAREFGLNQIAIAGLSTESEPSVKDIAEISRFAKDNNVKYIFFESLVSPKLSQTIATEVGAQTLVLNPIEGLSAEEVSSGKDYFSEMRSNLANLELALECSK